MKKTIVKSKEVTFNINEMTEHHKGGKLTKFSDVVLFVARVQQVIEETLGINSLMDDAGAEGWEL